VQSGDHALVLQSPKTWWLKQQQAREPSHRTASPQCRTHLVHRKIPAPNSTGFHPFVASLSRFGAALSHDDLFPIASK
jgi:hypothetical protein